MLASKMHLSLEGNEPMRFLTLCVYIAAENRGKIVKVVSK
jgi:hypothetical protein